MGQKSEEQVVSKRFSKIYENVNADIRLTIERSVCGCDYGGTSWTSVDEARKISKMLTLKPRQQILDIVPWQSTCPTLPRWRRGRAG